MVSSCDDFSLRKNPIRQVLFEEEVKLAVQNKVRQKLRERPTKRERE